MLSPSLTGTAKLVVMFAHMGLLWAYLVVRGRIFSSFSLHLSVNKEAAKQEICKIQLATLSKLAVITTATTVQSFTKIRVVQSMKLTKCVSCLRLVKHVSRLSTHQLILGRAFSAVCTQKSETIGRCQSVCSSLLPPSPTFFYCSQGDGS